MARQDCSRSRLLGCSSRRVGRGCFQRDSTLLRRRLDMWACCNNPQRKVLGCSSVKGVKSTVRFIHLPPGHSPTGPASLGSRREFGEVGKITDQFDVSGRDHLASWFRPTGSKDILPTTALATENSTTAILKEKMENMVFNGMCSVKGLGSEEYHILRSRRGQSRNL